MASAGTPLSHDAAPRRYRSRGDLDKHVMQRSPSRRSRTRDGQGTSRLGHRSTARSPPVSAVPVPRNGGIAAVRPRASGGNATHRIGLGGLRSAPRSAPPPAARFMQGLRKAVAALRMSQFALASATRAGVPRWATGSVATAVAASSHGGGSMRLANVLAQSADELVAAGDPPNGWRRHRLIDGEVAGVGMGGAATAGGVGSGDGPRRRGSRAGIAARRAGAGGAATAAVGGGRSRAPVPRGPSLNMGIQSATATDVIMRG